MKTIIYKEALARKVLVIAKLNYQDEAPNEGILFDWACYIDAVNGIDHDEEKYKVVSNGTKLAVELAHILFPQVDIEKYRK